MSSFYNHLIPSKRLSNASTNDDFEIETKRERLGSLDSNDKQTIHFKKTKNVSFKDDLVEIVEVQKWKRYNVDVSEHKHILLRQLKMENRVKAPEVEPVLCNCVIM